MRNFILALLLLLSSITIYGQNESSCNEAARQASDLIASAQGLISNGKHDAATSILDAAKILLDDCNLPSDTSNTVPTLTPEDSESVESTPTSLPTTPSTTEEISANEVNYTLTPREVDETKNISFVRFAHTSVDAGPIDIYMGQDLILANLNYGEATKFIPIQAGERSFRARKHGDGPEGTVLYHLSWNYLSNSSWIVTAAGLSDAFAFIVEPISVIRNNYNNQARVRIVNLVAGAPRTTVTTDSGQTLGNGLGWVGIKDNMLQPGTYRLQASTSNGLSLNEPVSFDFEANITYTLYVTGDGTDASPLNLLNMASPADATQVMFRNKSQVTVDLHYRPGNDLLVTNLDANAESSWSPLLSGAYTFITYAPGTGPTGQELASLATQLRPQRYMIFEIVGNRINTVYEGLTPPEN